MAKFASFYSADCASETARMAQIASKMQDFKTRWENELLSEIKQKQRILSSAGLKSSELFAIHP